MYFFSVTLNIPFGIQTWHYKRDIQVRGKRGKDVYIAPAIVSLQVAHHIRDVTALITQPTLRCLQYPG